LVLAGFLSADYIIILNIWIFEKPELDSSNINIMQKGILIIFFLATLIFRNQDLI